MGAGPEHVSGQAFLVSLSHSNGMLTIVFSGVFSKYSFKAKRPKLTDPSKEEQDLEASVWTLSALLSQGDPNIMFAHAPSGTSLEERVAATLSAELAAVFSHQAQEAGAHAHLGLYDEPEPENEDDEDAGEFQQGGGRKRKGERVFY